MKVLNKTTPNAFGSSKLPIQPAKIPKIPCINILMSQSKVYILSNYLKRLKNAQKLSPLKPENISS